MREKNSPNHNPGHWVKPGFFCKMEILCALQKSAQDENNKEMSIADSYTGSSFRDEIENETL